MPTARGYVILVLSACAAFLVPVAALNLQLAANDLAADKTRLASEWQQARRGVTYAPPISRNRPFKTLRLNDRLPEINTVVFGSSTMMGIRSEAFPPGLRAYNFAQSGNSLVSVIAEAEYIADHWGSRVRFLVIPLDWALGFVSDGSRPQPTDLSAAAVRATGASQEFSALEQLRDALSRPRVLELGAMLKSVLRASEPARAFRQLFFEPAGEEYRCPDGTPARDFDTLFRGMCVGFRFDGSATFADQKRVNARELASVLLAAAGPSSKYSVALRASGGKPERALLERLAALAGRVEKGGGRVILLLPPLLPGLEAELARVAHTRAALGTVKAELAGWAQRERLMMLDAGASEQFGCAPQEFIDPHHALPECYAKVFARLLGADPRLACAPRDGWQFTREEAT